MKTDMHSDADAASSILLAAGFAHELHNALGAASQAVEAIVSPDMPGGSLAARLQSSGEALASNNDASIAAENREAFNEDLQRLTSLTQLIAEGVTRGLALTLQFLEFSKLGELRAGDDSVLVKDVVAEVLLQSQVAIERHGIVIQDNVDRSLVTLMRSSHLQMALRNLVDNACYAVAHSGKTGGTLRIDAHQANGRVQICVQDNGMGMSETTQQSLFKPFFTTKGSEGTGLGLGLTKRLVELYGGTLRCASQEGQGTRFDFDVPTAAG